MLTTEFLLTSLVVVLIPGTGVIYTVTNGLFLGWRASIAAAIGCTFGIVPHLVACILGLSAVLHMSAVAFQCIKYAGALYLLYLAYAMWKETGGIQLSKKAEQTGMIQIGIRGILLNILNPKLSIFFLAFLPLFISADTTTPMADMLLLSGVFMAMTFFVFILYGFFANAVRKYIVHSPRIVSWVQRSFAVTFAALGIKLAMAER